MNNGGDAAEQIVRLSLEGFEVAVRLTGSAAKNIAILLASVLKQEISQSNKTRGKARLTNMIKSGKELKVFSFQQKDLPKFTEQAKRYGVLYCVLRDKNTKSDTRRLPKRKRKQSVLCRRFQKRSRKPLKPIGRLFTGSRRNPRSRKRGEQNGSTKGTPADRGAVRHTR